MCRSQKCFESHNAKVEMRIGQFFARLHGINFSFWLCQHLYQKYLPKSTYFLDDILVLHLLLQLSIVCSLFQCKLQEVGVYIVTSQQYCALLSIQTVQLFISTWHYQQEHPFPSHTASLIFCSCTMCMKLKAMSRLIAIYLQHSGGKELV